MKATAGDTHLGGEDFDNRLVKYAMDEFNKKYGVSLESSARLSRRLRTLCEQCKCELSQNNNATIEMNDLKEVLKNTKFKKNEIFKLNVTRQKFEAICEDLFRYCFDPVEKVIHKSNL